VADAELEELEVSVFVGELAGSDSGFAAQNGDFGSGDDGAGFVFDSAEDGCGLELAPRRRGEQGENEQSVLHGFTSP
jgi:hypothetical protein